jgi:hypothetical protein
MSRTLSCSREVEPEEDLAFHHVDLLKRDTGDVGPGLVRARLAWVSRQDEHTMKNDKANALVHNFEQLVSASGEPVF